MNGHSADRRMTGARPRGPLEFPTGFVWGTATAAYQVEGATGEDGRGQSIWDTFCRIPGAVHHGDSGDVACDHYHRIAEDADLIAGLGLGAYRFSIAWPRIQPDGTGQVNQRGIDHYRRLVDLLRGRGIAPVATLYHWDLPQPLEDRGGWPERSTADRFAEYAAMVTSAIDGVDQWITVNEPWVVAHEGYSLGSHAPGRQDFPAAIAATHHLLLGHARAAGYVREAGGSDARVGIALNLAPAVASSAAEADQQAAVRVDGYRNRWYLDPLLRGCYPADMVSCYERLAPLDFISDSDLAEICGSLDFLGITYYSPVVARALPTGSRTDASVDEAALEALLVSRPGQPVTAMGWPVEPGGLRDILLRVGREYPPLPLYVTENGAAFHDYVDPEGRVKDPERVAYLAAHIAATHEAIAAGADVRGYFCWSLLDNFEWAEGYSQRFGLVWVDYGTQRRTPKDSAEWFAGVARSNRLPTPGPYPGTSGRGES
ncbi:MAG TPA: GH1 family beta-glucosidase [Streptosporangiaceae bacterium]|nr:GH1 family beta-glucosidase [Streptosporangiaceae bacterium]